MLSLAHEGLQRARADLDQAMMQTEVGEAADDRMATPALVDILLGLLLDAVTARRHLEQIEETRQEPRNLVSVARDPWR